MNNKEILEKAFQEAYKHGWRLAQYGNERPSVIEGVDYRGVLFSHDFAKSLWSFEPTQTVECYRPHLLKEWQWHLQRMVIADDPIKYLGENI